MGDGGGAGGAGLDEIQATAPPKSSVDWDEYGGGATTLQKIDSFVRSLFGEYHEQIFGKPGAFDANNIVEHTVIAAVSCGLGVMLVFYWWNRDWLLEPEVHRGVWHTCDDPKLKGKWHWSCCDALDQKAKCTNNAEYARALKDFRAQRDNLLFLVTFGKMGKRKRA